MNAIAPARPAKGAAMLDETIDYERQPVDSDGPPTGADSGRNPVGRYTFGSGARPLEGYTIKRAIGRGGFGEVYYAVTDAGKEVALKLITRDLDIERRGVMQCMNLKSPNLITIHDLRETDDGDTFVIMEYVAGPNLASVLEKYPHGMPLEEVRLWLRGLVEGVSYLHDHGIVHRDLKPANLFLEEGVVKIGDYGLSKSINQSKEPGHSRSVGTCHYMAPEIGTGKYHKPIDIYAIGVILYEMITGRVPFDGESVHEVLMKHLTSRADLSPLPEPYRTIVGLALSKDPNHRPERAVELLPPGEAPRSPDMRFIPESSKSAASGNVAPPKDDVLHIKAEDPVFYIGPDTRPPKPGLRGALAAAERKIKRMADPRPMPRPAARAARPIAPAHKPVKPLKPAKPPKKAVVPEPPPAPPAIPTGRARMAELGTSMLIAAGAAAIVTALSVPAFGVLYRRVPSDPTQLASVFALTLLGSWGVLIPAKLWEGREIANGSKRSTYLLVGALVGLAGAGLVSWGHMAIPGQYIDGPASEVVDFAGKRLPSEVVNISALAAYFALAFGLNGFWKLAARDRRARFRIVPIVVTGLLAGFTGAFVPSPQPGGLIIVAAIAAVTQVASPWSREAAAYARFQQAFGRKKVA